MCMVNFSFDFGFENIFRIYVFNSLIILNSVLLKSDYINDLNISSECKV